MDKDFLDEIVAERKAKNPDFDRLMDEATQRRVWARELAAMREAKHMSQTQVAAKMNTSPSVISKFEGGGDVKLSTIQRYMSVVGASLPSLRASAKPSNATAGKAKRTAKLVRA